MTTHQLIQRRTITDTGCWNFTGTKTGGKCGGYGAIYSGGKMVLVHRLSYLLFKRALIPGKVIAHTCHNRQCFNPAHLKQTTQHRNLLDGVKLGTVKWAKKRNN